MTRKTFDAFVDWLYLRNLPGQKSEDELPDTGKDGEEHESFLNSHEIIEIHIFADRYDIPDLQRDSINTMFAYFKRTEEIPTAETITMAFESLPDTSLLCKLLAHQYCRSTSNMVPEDELLWTNEILHVVLAGYRHMIWKLENLYGLRELELCDYHYHGSREERDKCRGWTRT